ncbi:MAG: hypothetical protein Athens071425_567 [Parcubacteria group bacterium Athens0714_25]|nr:MAG: hypothetical protein Athens071425_567 [Parcubacteria group bacterium Athens0714_25]
MAEGGMIIVSEGMFSLEEVAEILRGNKKFPKDIYSRGFKPAKIKQKFRTRNGRGRSGKCRIFTREEILYEEMCRHAINKPMIIIGTILIMIEIGYNFFEIDSEKISTFIEVLKFEKITRQEIGRVLMKLEDSNLFERLVLKNQIGLQAAYRLYR